MQDFRGIWSPSMALRYILSRQLTPSSVGAALSLSHRVFQQTTQLQESVRHTVVA